MADVTKEKRGIIDCNNETNNIDPDVLQACLLTTNGMANEALYATARFLSSCGWKRDKEKIQAIRFMLDQYLDIMADGRSNDSRSRKEEYEYNHVPSRVSENPTEAEAVVLHAKKKGRVSSNGSNSKGSDGKNHSATTQASTRLVRSNPNRDWERVDVHNGRFFLTQCRKYKDLNKKVKKCRLHARLMERVGGAVTCAYELQREFPDKKIGIMVAGNSGRPGGSCGNDMTVRSIHEGHRTQEEDLVSSWMLEEAGIDESAQNQLFAETIARLYGMCELESRSTKTLQGVDYVNTKDPEDFADVWVVKNAKLRGRNNEGRFDPHMPIIGTLVFSAGPNVGCRRSVYGSTTRTFCREALYNWGFFLQSVRACLRASIDAMIADGVDIALIARVSCGVYAGKHRQRINNDFLTILDSILDEQIDCRDPRSPTRGNHFREVVVPMLWGKLDEVAPSKHNQGLVCHWFPPLDPQSLTKRKDQFRHEATLVFFYNAKGKRIVPSTFIKGCPAILTVHEVLTIDNWLCLDETYSCFSESDNCVILRKLRQDERPDTILLNGGPYSIHNGDMMIGDGGTRLRCYRQHKEVDSHTNRSHEDTDDEQYVRVQLEDLPYTRP